jgi:hypothetical protein
MKSKMDSMYVNQVLILVDLPEGIKLIGSKWVFKRKSDIDGNLQAYKVILVAKFTDKDKGLTLIKPSCR